MDRYAGFSLHHPDFCEHHLPASGPDLRMGGLLHAVGGLEYFEAALVLSIAGYTPIG
jgi:hypothetical protein